MVHLLQIKEKYSKIAKHFVKLMHSPLFIISDMKVGVFFYSFPLSQSGGAIDIL